MLRFSSSPDYETAADTGGDNNYVVTVTASDGTNSDTKDVVIIVTNVDEAGTVNLSTLQPQVEVALTATLVDSDGVVSGTPAWMWFRGSSVIVSETSTTYVPVVGDIGFILEARATYRDGEDTKNDKTAVGRSARSVLSEPNSNTAPAFPDQDVTTTGSQTAQTRMVAENTPSGRNIGAPVVATDSGDVLTYSIDPTAEVTFDIDRATGQLKTQAPLDAEGDAVGTTMYTVAVTATDPSGASATSEVTITVTDVDEDPSITTAGAETALPFAEEDGDIETALATYTATDPEEAVISWDVSGPDAGKFDIGVGALTFRSQPDFESPGDANGDNVYEVTVVARDPAGNSDELNVLVKVTNEAEMGTIELSSLAPKVGVALMATLDDPDGHVTGLMWQWSNEGTPIEDETSDTYMPVAEDVTDMLTVTATYRDGSLAADDDAITLTSSPTVDVVADTDNKAPVFPDQDTERTVAENTVSGEPIGVPVVAADVATAADGMETDEILTYTLGGADMGSFSIDRGTGQLSTKADLDYETKRSYTVMVTATDPGGLSATATVTIEVTGEDEAPEMMRAPDANVAPEFADSEGGARSVAENTATGEDIGKPVAAADANGDAPTYAMGGTDAVSFEIDTASGQLMTLTDLDYETKATYSVTVTASDSGGLSDSINVTITVTNVEEVGAISLSATQPAVGEALTATLTDPDSPSGVTGVVWQWASENTDDSTYTDIAGATSDRYTPAAADDGKHLRVTATYSDGYDASNERTARSENRVTGDPLLVRYDANNDGWIQLEEARVAVGDYFGPPKGVNLSLDDTRKVVGLYFEYKNRQ